MSLNLVVSVEEEEIRTETNLLSPFFLISCSLVHEVFNKGASGTRSAISKPNLAAVILNWTQVDEDGVFPTRTARRRDLFHLETKLLNGVFSIFGRGGSFGWSWLLWRWLLAPENHFCEQRRVRKCCIFYTPTSNSDNTLRPATPN